MVEAVGARVLKLVRVKVGSIGIGRLPIGQWRLLTRAEVEALTGGNSELRISEPPNDHKW
jgi:16S rRNA U516 pseudouridylate synthase RsuA-like enzyme